MRGVSPLCVFQSGGIKGHFRELDRPESQRCYPGRSQKKSRAFLKETALPGIKARWRFVLLFRSGLIQYIACSIG